MALKPGLPRPSAPRKGAATCLRGFAGAWIASAAFLACTPAGAQPLFKCGGAHGRIEYRESGCDAGTRETALRTGTVTGLDAIPPPRVHRKPANHARSRTPLAAASSQQAQAPRPAGPPSGAP